MSCSASIRYDDLPPYVCVLPAGHKGAHSNGINMTWTATGKAARRAA